MKICNGPRSCKTPWCGCTCREMSRDGSDRGTPCGSNLGDRTCRSLCSLELNSHGCRNSFLPVWVREGGENRIQYSSKSPITLSSLYIHVYSCGLGERNIPV